MLEGPIKERKGSRSPLDTPKKVGVLTFHRCINYGSYWQAKCLAEGIQNQGFNAVLLDHVSPKTNLAEWRCALRPTLPIQVPRADQNRYAQKIRSFEAEFKKLPLSKPFDIEHPEDMEELDTVVIGSDEVWNLYHPWYAARPAFFGVGLPAKRVVAHAASFGNYSCWEGIGTPWTDFLSRLDSISVRDENSWWMLKNTLGLETDIVLDPCLQFPPTPEGPWTGPKEPFALVYGHNFSPEFACQTRLWADRQRLPLLSLGYRNDWADLQWLEAGPHDFAHAMAQTQALATNFFHGCVFALTNQKPFACEISPYRSIKIRGLMEHLGGEDRLIETDRATTRFEALLSEPAGENIQSRLQASRQISQNSLAAALGVHVG